MDNETFDQLSKSISELVEETRRKNKESYYIKFNVKYYAVVDGKAIESPTTGIFRNCQWGCVGLYYFEGHFDGGYPRASELYYVVTPEGYVSDSMRIGNLKISCLHGHMEVKTQDNKFLFYTKKDEVADAMNEVLPLIPLLQGCRSREEADMIVEIKANNQELNQREDMVSILMEEVRRLRSTVSDYEKIFEEIRAKLPTK